MLPSYFPVSCFYSTDLFARVFFSPIFFLIIGTVHKHVNSIQKPLSESAKEQRQ